MKRLASLLAAGALILTACGGSDPAVSEGDPGEDTTTVAVDTTAQDDGGAGQSTVTTATSTTGSDSTGESTGGGNVATVTIGDQTFEFDANPEGPITDCNPDFFGAFWVVGGDPDGNSLNLLLPAEGDANFDDPPSVRVVDRGTGADWTADVSLLETGNYEDVLDAGDSQVDSYTVEGNTASGTATFVDENQIFAVLGGTADSVEPVTGAFEVTCAG